MKNLKLTSLAVVTILFGTALVEAIQKQNWLEVILFLTLVAIALWADLQKNKYVMPEVGIEPTSLAGHDFKSCAYTNSATRAKTIRQA